VLRLRSIVVQLFVVRRHASLPHPTRLTDCC